MKTPARIQKLSDATVNLIAAGEVIERPASIVKELLENALDAGAARVTLELTGGGKEGISVMDDGCGIAAADAALVFERHATSKIAGADDLHRITTLGFRGEALSSIAAVAEVEILTRTAEEAAATVLFQRPGEALEVKKGARTIGTTVSVRHIFRHLPVRQRFQKSTSSENSRILSLLSAVACGHPEVAFRLLTDGKERFNLTAVNDPVARIRDVFGEVLAQSLIRGTASAESFDVEVFFSNLDYTRNNRTGQLFFVNQRLVENRALFQGVTVGYRDLLPPGRYPVAFVFIKINPDEVDVNVHPAKKEIRFIAEESLLRAVSRAILNGFEGKGAVRSFSNPLPSAFSPPPMAPSTHGSQPSHDPHPGPPLFAENLPNLFSESGNTPGGAPAGPAELFLPTPNLPETEEGGQRLLIAYLQLHNTYILSQIKNGLLIIDQHVAHERILYEKILKSLSKGEAPLVQQLLFPVNLDLSHGQREVMERFAPFFEKSGFSVQFLSGKTVMIDGVPAGLEHRPLQDVIFSILESLEAGPAEGPQVDQRFAKSFSCHAAIKAGQPLTQEEINTLVDMLFQCENPYTCPHGRPIVIRIPVEEIGRRFLRYGG